MPAGFGRAAHFRCGIKYLSANAGGGLACDRDKPNLWETFVLLNVDEFDELCWAASNDWAIFEGESVFSHVIKIGSDFKFLLGDTSLDLRSGRALFPDYIDTRTSVKRPRPKKFVVMKEGWQVLFTLVLIRPIIYFVAFGSDETFHQLRWSIESLLNLANFRGQIHVISNKTKDGLLDFLPENIVDVISVQEVGAVDYVDFALSRYLITEWGDANEFQPILYSDTDVVFEGDLLPLFNKIVLHAGIHAAAESFSPRSTTPGAGSVLFERDGTDVGASYGFNAGVMAVSSLAVAQQFFRLVPFVRLAYAASQGRTTDPVGDQPFVNYCAHKLACIDTSILTSLIRIGSPETHDRPERTPCITHFWRCRGQAEKRRVVENYVKIALKKE